MSHQRRVLVDTPVFHEICLHLEELGILVLKERLALLVPFPATGKITQRQDVTRLTHRGRPYDRTAVFLRTAIGIGVTHLRHKAVGHRSCDIRIVRQDAVKLCRRGVHILIRENQRTERMAMLIGSGPIVGQLASSHMPAEIAGTIQYVHGCLHRGGWSTVISAWDVSPAKPAFVLRHGAEGIPRRDDAWEGYGDI